MTSWLDPASPLPPEPVRRRVPSVWLDVRRSYEELGREIAAGVAALWAWSPPWSPSREVLDEIRRQAGALDEGQDDEVDEWRGQVIALERWRSSMIQQEAWSRATSYRWGEGTLEVVDESHVWLTVDMVEAWLSEALSAQLTEEQRRLLWAAYRRSASRPQTVDTDEVPAGVRRHYLNNRVRRNGRTQARGDMINPP